MAFAEVLKVVIRAKCKPYLHHGRPIRRTERTVDTDFSIVTQFQAEFRGVAEYYQLASNRHRLGLLRWIMERSLTKTLGHKNKISVTKVWNRYRATWLPDYRDRMARKSREANSRACPVRYVDLQHADIRALTERVRHPV